MKLRKTVLKIAKTHKNTKIYCQLYVPNYLEIEREFVIYIENNFIVSSNFDNLGDLYKDIFDQKVKKVVKNKIFNGWSFDYTFEIFLSEDYLEEKKQYYINNYPYTRESKFNEVREILSIELKEKAKNVLEKLVENYNDKNVDDIEFFQMCNLMIKYLPFVKKELQ